MNAIHHIRKVVFAVTQVQMAQIAQVSQGTVSKWENGETWPDQANMSLIREEAGRRGIVWDDRLFFEAPPQSAGVE